MIIDKSTLSLEESVYLRLQEDILSGELERGQSLTESALSSKYETSRTPVRSALHRLAEEGIVRSVPNKGAVVVGIDEELLVDIYQVRMRLEGLASSLAAERIDKESLALLEETVSLAEFYITRRDAETLKQLDTRFHETIYRASGNQMLEKTLGELHNRIKFYRKKSLSVPARLESSVKEHRGILEAIKRGDSVAADALTSEHVQRALDNILKASK